jgi:hypothetical protein
MQNLVNVYVFKKSIFVKTFKGKVYRLLLLQNAGLTGSFMVLQNVRFSRLYRLIDSRNNYKINFVLLKLLAEKGIVLWCGKRSFQNKLINCNTRSL